MKDRQNQKNRIQFISAVVGALFLLALVFGSTLWLHNNYKKDRANVVLKELNVHHFISLIQTGKTHWR
ncbi:MAG: hypothetical protein RR977_03080, partial [Oscillospiraceae bacterium]